MWRLARIAMMWLLAAAVPLEGMAAATMISCGSAQHGQIHVHAAGHGHEDGDAADVDTPTMHAHASDAGVSMHDHASADHADFGASGLGHNHLSHKCSACSSCCVSAVLPTQAISFEVVAPTDFFTPFVARSFAARVAEGLERPPRSFLA